MTPLQRDDIQRWIDAVRPTVGLADWRIEVQDEPSKEHRDAIAATWIGDGEDLAKVHLNEAFWDEAPAERRIALTHELVHVHLHRFHLAALDLADRLGPEARAIAEQRLEQLEELAVHRIARALGPYLPALP